MANDNEIKAWIADAEAVLADQMVIMNRLNASIEGLKALSNEPSKPVQTPFETPLNPVLNAAQHLREHRPGRPSRIDSDPEPRAFIMARIETTTFPDLDRDVAERFPPERRVKKSTIHKWRQRRVQNITKPHPQ